ncbi:biotin transporter BioY [Brevibacillus dissolubilis]|uniref:biotin transporter BioY n=1 Tax=Brevibacillus dissolubilis TaxID=1844116 RepID=UPI0011167558|nr:biotin transporter BioY [Brevibacillus dissolubilis]
MKTRDIALAAMMIAITTALGYFKVTLPINEVPITFQTLGIILAGLLLGARLGGLSILAFVILVAVGAPLLGGGRGGFSVLVGASGGYILSWPIVAFLLGYMVEKSWNSLNFWKVLGFNIVGGMLVMYLIGIPYQAAITGVPVLAVAVKSLIFLPGDLIKGAIASLIAVRIRKMYPLIQPKSSPTQHIPM